MNSATGKGTILQTENALKAAVVRGRGGPHNMTNDKLLSDNIDHQSILLLITSSHTHTHETSMI